MRCLIALILIAASAPALAQEARVTLETAPDGTRTLIHELIIPATTRAVWRALATAKGWQTWAAPVVRRLSHDRFETNYDPAAPLGAPSGIQQQWLRRDAPRSAAFRTVRTPDGFPHSGAYMRVVSTFVLSPVGARATRVRLTGTGYPAGVAGDALIGFFRTGNAIAFRQLFERFKSGPIDWKARAAQNRGEGNAGN